MLQTFPGERQLTELDSARLRLLGGAAPPELLALLDEADLLQSQAIPADVVTMRAKVDLEDPQTGRRQQLTLVYPQEAAPAAGLVSVLSPLGLALLGQRAGATVEWRTPHDGRVVARIAAVVFQPESQGDYLS